MTVGIYKITNNLNNKSYIGQSIHIEQRIQEHKSEAFSHNEQRLAYNSIIHKAIRKNGWSNFSWSILEECPIGDLDEKERFWIKKYNTLSPNGYNILIGGQKYRKNFECLDDKEICPRCGGHKSRQSHICNVCYKKQNVGKAYNILQQEGKDNVILAILDSSYETVAASFGFFSTHGLKKAIKKIGWPYLKKDMFDYFYYKNGYYHKKDKRRKPQKYKKVYQIDKDTHKITDSFYLSPENCKQRKMHSEHIIECCKGKRTEYKGFIFRFVSSPIKVVCVDVKTNMTIKNFTSLHEAAQWCQSTGASKSISANSISHKIKSACTESTSYKTAFGYSWQIFL